METASLPLPKTRKGRARRDQILETATRYFAVQGYRNVSLAAIAEQVGITEQGAMHYFPTKEHLLTGVLEYRDARDRERWTRLQQERPELTLLDAIAAIMAHNVEDEPGLATLYSVLMAESVDPLHGAHDWFRRRNLRMREELAGAVVESQGRNEIRADLEPADVAAQMIAMFDGLALQWSLDPERVDAVAAMRSFTHALRP